MERMKKETLVNAWVVTLSEYHRNKRILRRLRI